MTSIVRSIAQRKTNVNEIIPVFGGTTTENTPFGDLSGAAYYTLNLTTVPYTGGSFFVDLSNLNISGRFFTDLSGIQIPIVNFIINVAMPASYIPNMEFTIYFKNATLPLLTVGILPNAETSFPFIFSPPVPLLVGGPYGHPSITFKSNGTSYVPIASGPAGWLGPYLIALLVNSVPQPT